MERVLAQALRQSMPPLEAAFTSSRDAEAVEMTRLQAALTDSRNKNDPHRAAAAPAGASFIPQFYRSLRAAASPATPAAAAATSSPADEGTGSNTAGASSPRSAAAFEAAQRVVAALQQATREIEATSYMRTVEQWTEINDALWDALVHAARDEGEHASPTVQQQWEASGSTNFMLSYAGYCGVASVIDPKRADHLAALLPPSESDAKASTLTRWRAATLGAERTYAANSAALLPILDAELFLTTPREAKTGCVDIRRLYEALQVRIATVRFAAEIVRRDADGDGAITDEELEGYVEATLPTIPGSEEVAGDFAPIYCATVARRFVWAIDTTNRGRLEIDKLLTCEDLSRMIVSQLRPIEEPTDPEYWFSPGATMVIYRAFAFLDTRQQSSLRVGDFRKYRRVFPGAGSDHEGRIPRDVSAISYSFIRRYFEVTPTFEGGEIDFRFFLDFVLNVEMLPRCPRPQIFFDCFDLDGSGVLTPTKLYRFMNDTRQKLVADFDSLGATLLRQTQDLFQLVPSAVEYTITRQEFIASPNAGQFAACLIDVLALVAYEKRDWTMPGIKQEELGRRPFHGRR